MQRNSFGVKFSKIHYRYQIRYARFHFSRWLLNLAIQFLIVRPLRHGQRRAVHISYCLSNSKPHPFYEKDCKDKSRRIEKQN